MIRTTKNQIKSVIGAKSNVLTTESCWLQFRWQNCHLQEGGGAQGPRSKFASGGAKEECVKENFGRGRGGHACGFLFNFSKVTQNANNDKTIDGCELCCRVNVP